MNKWKKFVIYGSLTCLVLFILTAALIAALAFFGYNYLEDWGQQKKNFRQLRS